MEAEITMQIILIKPTQNVVFGLQKGAGNNYETVQKQISTSDDLTFTFSIKVKGDRSKDELPKLSGTFVQGPADSKFVYIDIGTYAGQTDTHWSRRLKIPLTGITWKEIDSLHGDSLLQTIVPGTGRDGGPNCATVKPFAGWYTK
ncbi:hypothetical protein SAMN04487996_101337 [Dyadobacter soli]|uniref:Uncharacterized protein n=1 Tax=Dyadobacter soli TaxID=659014 RepID=A0A1G6VVK8_9BACT|nr:DUF5990 family protein [Dyadobacter soli]SDD56856.1 hypothetical protein SAMN04487996_101337 [Dyadobacter soli]